MTEALRLSITVRYVSKFLCLANWSQYSIQKTFAYRTPLSFVILAFKLNLIRYTRMRWSSLMFPSFYIIWASFCKKTM